MRPCSNVLEDADALRVDGLVYKIYNAEFKVDVFFPAPQLHHHASVPDDLADAYLHTDVSALVSCCCGACLCGAGGGGVFGVSRHAPSNRGCLVLSVVGLRTGRQLT